MEVKSLKNRNTVTLKKGSDFTVVSDSSAKKT